MEIRCSGIFYMGIAKGERARRKQLERDGLSIRQVERRFPYALLKDEIRAVRRDFFMEIRCSGIF